MDKIVTIKMLDELNEKQRKKLMEICRNNEYEFLYNLTIGDMLEILENANEKYTINNIMVKLNTALSLDDCNAYAIRLFNSNREYRSDNLVIALWNAVKSIL